MPSFGSNRCASSTKRIICNGWMPSLTGSARFNWRMMQFRMKATASVLVSLSLLGLEIYNLRCTQPALDRLRIVSAGEQVEFGNFLQDGKGDTLFTTLLQLSSQPLEVRPLKVFKRVSDSTFLIRTQLRCEGSYQRCNLSGNLGVFCFGLASEQWIYRL
mgnify:CR=1 FL=1